MTGFLKTCKLKLKTEQRAECGDFEPAFVGIQYVLLDDNLYKRCDV